jgi:hypothetical protein
MCCEGHVTEYVRTLDPQTSSKNRKILLFMDFYAANPKDKLLKKYASCVLAPKLHQQYSRTSTDNNQTIQTLLP